MKFGMPHRQAPKITSFETSTPEIVSRKTNKKANSLFTLIFQILLTHFCTQLRIKLEMSYADSVPKRLIFFFQLLYFTHSHFKEIKSNSSLGDKY